MCFSIWFTSSSQTCLHIRINWRSFKISKDQTTLQKNEITISEDGTQASVFLEVLSWFHYVHKSGKPLWFLLQYYHWKQGPDKSSTRKCWRRGSFIGRWTLRPWDYDSIIAFFKQSTLSTLRNLSFFPENYF